MCYLHFPGFFLSDWLNSYFFALLDFFALFQLCEVILQKPISGSGLHLDLIFSKTLISIGFEVWGFRWPKTSLPINCTGVSE